MKTSPSPADCSDQRDLFSPRRLLRIWSAGILTGTLLIAVTSQWFVRSYVPRVEQPDRSVLVLTPGSRLRWRQEGYATTRIGPMGMPGRTMLPRADADQNCVLLWGDSQAEGVCVPDPEKIASQVGQLGGPAFSVLPMARSGDDCNDWIRQIEALEGRSTIPFAPDVHLFLLTEWSDWCVDIASDTETLNHPAATASRWLPAFVIQAARNALTTGTEGDLRTLRFRPGPATDAVTGGASVNEGNTDRRYQRLLAQLERLRRITSRKCIFLYAPLYPAISGGRILDEDPDDGLFQRFRRHCGRLDFVAVDLRRTLSESARRGCWPRGFHHGQWGVGHYNAMGNRLIAEAAAGELDRISGPG